MREIKAVIFDMDGVIVESEYRNYLAKIEILKPYGVYFDYDYYSQFPGNSNLVVWEKIIKDFSINESAAVLHRADLEKREELIKLNGHQEVEGAIDLIKRLSKKYTLALASGSPERIIYDTVDYFGIEKYFDYIISGETVERCKPAPDIFLITAKNLNIPFENCAVIEDSENGVKAAKSAGMYCIGFENKNSGNQELSLADVIVASHSENPL